MKYYKVVVKMGHFGARKSKEVPVYIFAQNITEAIDRSKRLPAIKHSSTPLSVKEISKEEYEAGRIDNKYKKMIQANKMGTNYEEGCNLY